MVSQIGYAPNATFAFFPFSLADCSLWRALSFDRFGVFAFRPTGKRLPRAVMTKQSAYSMRTTAANGRERPPSLIIPAMYVTSTVPTLSFATVTYRSLLGIGRFARSPFLRRAICWPSAAPIIRFPFGQFLHVASHGRRNHCALSVAMRAKCGHRFHCYCSVCHYRLSLFQCCRAGFWRRIHFQWRPSYERLSGQVGARLARFGRRANRRIQRRQLCALTLILFIICGMKCVVL